MLLRSLPSASLRARSFGWIFPVESRRGCWDGRCGSARCCGANERFGASGAVSWLWPRAHLSQMRASLACVGPTATTPPGLFLFSVTVVSRLSASYIFVLQNPSAS
jgi:hypothetical protein